MGVGQREKRWWKIVVKVSLAFMYRLLLVLRSLTDFYSHDAMILVTNLIEL